MTLTAPLVPYFGLDLPVHLGLDLGDIFLGGFFLQIILEITTGVSSNEVSGTLLTVYIYHSRVYPGLKINEPLYF